MNNWLSNRTTTFEDDTIMEEQLLLKALVNKQQVDDETKNELLNLIDEKIGAPEFNLTLEIYKTLRNCG